MPQNITSSAIEPVNNLEVPVVGGDTDTWGDILVEETFVFILGYILWLYENRFKGTISWGNIDGQLADQPDLAAALNDTATAAQGAKADSAVQPGDPIQINSQAGTSYTFVLTDSQKLITTTAASNVTLTIPPEASTDFPIGTVIAVARLGTGSVTIQGATGVTVNGVSAGSEDLVARYATASLTKIDADTWLISGGLAE